MSARKLAATTIQLYSFDKSSAEPCKSIEAVYAGTISKSVPIYRCVGKKFIINFFQTKEYPEGVSYEIEEDIF